MFNPLKLQLRIKIIAAILFALFISFLFIKPKENDIPILPIAMQIDLTQQEDNSFRLRNISVVDGYAPDYQNDFQSNYYRIELKKEDKVLYTGKMIKQHIVIHEWLKESPHGEVTEEKLGDFSLYLPYYKDATELVITEDTGKEALKIDVTSKELVAPKLSNTCGDGVCTDNENLMMCYTDCKYLLPKWMPK